MGEAYKGLTIRIGANTTSLESALKNVNRSLTQTQTLLNIVKKGLRFDPTSTKLLSTQLDTMRERVIDNTQKVALMKQKYDELAANPALARLDALGEQFGLHATNTRVQYEQLTNILEGLHLRMEQLAADAGTTWDHQNQSVQEFREAVMNAAGATDKQRAEAQQLYETCRDLASSYVALEAEMSNIRGVEEMRKLEAQTQAAEAETKALVSQLVQLKVAERSAADAGEMFKELKADLSTNEVAVKSLKAELDRLDAAMQIDPSNMDLFTQRERTAKEYAESLNVTLEQQKAKMRNLESRGVQKSAASMRELKEHTRNATAQLEKMETEAADLARQIATAQRQLALYDNELKAGIELTAEEKRDRLQASMLIKGMEIRQRDLNNRIEQMIPIVARATEEEEYRELTVAIRQTEAAQKSLNTSIDNGGRKLDRVRDLATALGATITPVLMTLGYRVISAANDIDAAYRDMRKTVQGTEEDFVTLREAALKFSQTHAVSADTLLEIEAMGGQLGIAVENLQSFAEVASNLDIATDIDADTIAQQLGQMMNVMQLTGESAEEFQANVTSFGDALVRLGNNMPAQESAIMNIATRMASVGTLVDMSADEILAWSAAAASTGQGAEALGTNLSKVLGQMEAAVGGYRTGLDDGIKHTQQFAEIIGISANEFADMWDRSATEALRTFIAALRQVDEDGGYVDAALQEMEITSIREKTALEGLTNTLGVLDDALKMSNDAWNGAEDEWGAAGDAAREAANKSEGFSGALQILKNSAQVLGATIGDSLTPVLQGLSKILTMVTDVFGAMPRAMRITSMLALGAVAALGPVLRIITQLRITLGSEATAANLAAAKTRTLGDVLQKSAAKAQLMATGMTKAEAKTKTAGVATQLAAEKVRWLEVQLKQGSALLARTSGAAQKAGISMQLFATKLQLAALKSEFLGAALTVTKGLLVGIASMAVLSGIIKLASSMKESSERAALLHKNAKYLKNVLDNTAISFKGAARAAGQYAPTLNDLKEKVNSVAEAQSRMIESFEQTKTTAMSDIAELETYAGIVMELANGSMLTSQQQERLAQSVDLLNTKYGASLKLGGEYNSILVDEEGNYLDTTEAIGKYLEAKEQEIQTKAYMDMLRTSIENDTQAYVDMADAATTVVQETKKLEEMASNPNLYSSEEIQAQANAAKDARDRYLELEQAYSDAHETMLQMKDRVAGVTDDAEIIAQANEAIAGTADAAAQATGILADNAISIGEGADGAGKLSTAIDTLGQNLLAQEDALATTRTSWMDSFDGILEHVSYDMGEIDTTISGEVDNMDGHGYDMGLQLYYGMGRADTYIATAAQNWALIIKSYLGFSLPEKGPLRQVPIWPMHMAQEWAKGAEQAIPIYQDASSRVADAIASGLDTAHILEARDQAINMSMDAPTLGSTYVIYQTTLNGAVLNDDIQIQSVSRNFLTELMRKVDA